MEQKHTPEPWGITENPRQIVAANGSTVAKLTALDLPNARRIVACVNACAGFANEELEGASLYRDSFDAQKEIDALRADIATAEQDSRQKQARIDRLSDNVESLLWAVDRIYTWANNWDSEFMNDHDWKNDDFPRIQRVVEKAKGMS